MDCCKKRSRLGTLTAADDFRESADRAELPAKTAATTLVALIPAIIYGRARRNPGLGVASPAFVSDVNLVIVGGSLAGLSAGCMSGRHVIEILSSHLRRPFVHDASARVPVTHPLRGLRCAYW